MRKKIDFEGVNIHLEGEEWRSVVGYEGIYEVSNLGRVKRLKRNPERGKSIMRERMLSAYKDKDGYLSVNLSKNSLQKPHRLHRVVLSAFTPNPNKLPLVNHKNGVRDDNRLENLEWCDAKYNNSYGDAIEKRKKAQFLYFNKSIKVLQYTMNGDFVNGYYTTKDASRKTGISATDINYCLNKKANRAGEFQWIYKNGDIQQKIKASSIKSNKNIKVAQYSLDGKYIKTHENAKIAAQSVGLKSVSLCCLNKMETAGGFVWRYVSREEPPSLQIPITWTTRVKPVYQYSIDGVYINGFKNCAEASKAVNVKPSNICMCCLGKQKTCKGFVWSYTKL